MRDWASLSLEVVIATGLGWLCWRLAKLRRFYHDTLDDLMAEGEPSAPDH